MKNRPRQKVSKKAFVLPLCMMLLVFLVIIGFGMTWLAYSARLQTVQAKMRIMARTAADAGQAVAYYQLLEVVRKGGTTLPQQSTPLPLPGTNDRYSFTITAVGPRQYDIVSVGTSGSARRVIRSRAVVSGEIFEYAITAHDRIENNQGLVDGYNSLEGSYGKGNEELPIKIRTNAEDPGDIYINSGKIQEGSEILVGPGAASDPESVIKGEFIGRVSAASETMKFPPVIMPTDGLIESGPLTSGTLTTGSYWFSRLDLNQSALWIQGNVTLCISGDVNIKQGALNIIDNGNSSLNLYVGGNFIQNQGSTNRLTQDPSRLRIFGAPTCQLMQFDQNQSLYGVIYAPSATLEVNQGDLYGAFVAKDASFDQGKLHYDISIRDLDIGISEPTLKKRQWIEN
jgi:hypothetical protein